MSLKEIRNSRLFAELTQSEYDAFLETADLEYIDLSKEEVLVDEGERVRAFWIVAEGRLKGSRYRYDGSLDLVHLYTEGDIVGLDVVCTKTQKSPLQISSMNASRLVAFDMRGFDRDRLAERTHAKLQANIVRILADESIRKQYKIDVLYQKSLRARIAVFLRNMSEKVGGDVFEINMDREQFAQYLGVNRSALSHALSVMRKEGIIRFRKGHFEILNKQALDERNL
jgi:CRP-like cAMP-binding protein